MEHEFVNMKTAMEITGLCKKTLQNYDKEGKIETIRTSGRWRKFNIRKYLKENGIEVESLLRKKVIYCRVSSYDRKDDLERQVQKLKQKYKDYEIITDVGSGINFKRAGLKKIIDYAIKNKLDEVVVTYKDRLCRIGYDLLEHIFEFYSSAKITIENKEEYTVNEDITKDLIEIITVIVPKYMEGGPIN